MAPNPTRRASKAYAAAMKHIDLFTEQAATFRQEPGFARRIDAMTRGLLPGWDDTIRRRFSGEELIRLGDMMGEVAVSELWKRNGRVMYDLHPELADALYRSKMDRVPGDLFDRLPHINPLVILPDPWPIGARSDGLAAGYVRGFFIVGWSGLGICNSNNPDREGLALLFFYDVMDDDSGEIVPGVHRDLIPLPMDRDSFTATDTVAFAEQWQGTTYDVTQAKDAMKTFRPLIQKAFSVLTYLCTDNRDVQSPPEWTAATRKKTGKNRKAADRDPFWVRVGWYVGPALHSARQRAVPSARSGVSVPSGVEYGPQHRAGHFKTVWIGPGKTNERRQSTTRWVEPYWTKLEELPEGQDPATQVVAVDAQRGDPLRRRNTVGR